APELLTVRFVTCCRRPIPVAICTTSALSPPKSSPTVRVAAALTSAVVLPRTTRPWATVRLLELAAVPATVRVPVPILVRVLLLTVPPNVRVLVPITLTTALPARVTFPFQALFPLSVRRAPALFGPVPL